MQKYKKTIFGLVSIIIALTVTIFGIWYSYQKSQKSNSELRKQTEAQSIDQKNQQTNVTIKTDETEKNYTIENHEPTNLFELLKGLQQNTDDFSFEYTEYDFGVMITTINGITPDENHFWKIVVNGQDANVGAQDLQIKNGDNINLILTKIS